MGAIFSVCRKGAFCLTAPFLMGTQPKVASIPPLVWKRGMVIAYRGQRLLKGRGKNPLTHSFRSSGFCIVYSIFIPALVF